MNSLWLKACALTACLLLPATIPAQEAESGAGGGVDLSDWDWSAVEDTKPETPKRKRKKLDPNKPRVGETAKPDFEAEAKAAYAVFANAPEFEVIPSIKDPDMHPCLDCHDWAESDLNKRDLQEPHDNFRLQHGLHGKGEFWCFTCHHLENEGGLQTLEGEKLSFDEAYLVCSQCHSRQARDWVYGAHGKSVGGWQGKRSVYNCTACHYQHRPELKPRKPMGGPVIRMGLDRPDHWIPQNGRPHHQTKPSIWEKYAIQNNKAEEESQ